MVTEQIKIERYLAELRRQLNALFILRKADKKAPETEKSYTDGFIFAAMSLGILSRTRVEEVIEEVNQQVFNMSLNERLQYYKNKPADEVSLYDMPTYQRQGKEIGIN